MVKPFFKIKKEKEEKDYGWFIIEPLPKGFGQTIGNSLRRVLFSSLIGSAVYQIKIKGVRHQFSTLPGLKEDIVELILNLKKINFKLEGEEKTVLNLSKTGPGEVKASDIELPANVTIGNPEQYIGSLADKNSKLEMTLWIERGTGYVPSEERQVEEVGVIPVDSLFTPVVRVNPKVEETRVGRSTNFDKLILEIWTNGAVAPFSALNEAAKILVSFFEHIYNPREEKIAEVVVNPGVSQIILQTLIEELDLPIRVVNALKQAGYKKIADLHGKKIADLEKVRNLGAKSVKLVIEKLVEKGVNLS